MNNRSGTITLYNGSREVCREQFREMFQNHSAIMYLADPHTLQIIDVNCAAEQFYGYPRDVLLTMRLPDIAVITEEELRQKLDHESCNPPPLCICQHKLSSGAIRDVEVRATPITAPDLGEICFVIVQDITERIWAERALRASEHRYRTLFNSVPVGLYRTTPSGQILDCNAPVAHMLGYSSRETVLTMQATDFYVNPEDRLHWQRLVEQHETVRSFETRLRRRDGTTIWVSDNARGVRDAHGQIVAYEGSIEDVSTRKQFEEALRLQHHIAMAMNSASSQSESLKRLLTILLTIDGIDAGGVYQVHTDTGALNLIVHQGLSDTFVASVTHYEATTPEARLITAGVPVIVTAEDLNQQQGIRVAGNLSRQEGIQAIAVIPVQHEDRVIAVLNLASRTYDTIPHSTQEALDVIAAQVGEVLARLQAEEALRERTRQLDAFFAHSIDGYFFCMLDEPVDWKNAVDKESMLTHIFSHQRVTRFNAAILQLNGLRADQFQGLTPADLFAARLNYGRTVWRQLLDEGRAQIEMEIWDRANAQSKVLEGTYTALYDEHGQFLGNFGVHRDITERKQQEAQIKHLAFTDQLTGLPNRNRLYEVASEALTFTNSASDGITLLYLDIDRFKAVNDTLGHDAGDELLLRVAKRLQNGVGDDDMLARLGGDEFAILLPHTNVLQAIVTAHRTLERLRQPFDLHGQLLYLDGSIGIAVGMTGTTTFSTLLTQVDIAMYHAKATGGSVQVYEPAIVASRQNHLSLEADLRRVLKANDLTIFYQPILDIRTNQVVKVEALVRWNHPTRGLISPGAFLPLAEEAGLLASLDRCVLQTALRQVAAWATENPNLTMTINLTAQSLQKPNLVAEIAGMLATTGASPERIIIEITEHTAMRNLAVTQKVLQGIKKLGIHIALDDFGSGYASLTHLRQLPVDVLKLDKAFAAGIGHEPKDEAVIRALLRLGQGLDLMVIVEGVETQEQLAWLRAEGCRLIQGYLVGKPAPAEITSALWRSDNPGIG